MNDKDILKSNSLVNYYTSNPNEYSLKFHHYNIVVDNERQEEYKLLEKDIAFLRNYNKENSIIYFSDLNNLSKIQKNTNVFSYLDDIYLRIRNKNEYLEFKKNNIQINLIIELCDLKSINPKGDNITLQIDDVSKLPIENILELEEEYNIKNVLLGQIQYITNDYKHLFNILSKQYNIDINNKLELEKNNEVTNDIYDIETYKNIVKELAILIEKNKKENNLETFKSLFYYIAENVCYDTEGVSKTKIENQNIIGALFNKKTVCEGYSKLLKQVLSLLGFESIIVLGGGTKEDGGHVWNQVKIEEKWYNVDVAAQNYAISNSKNWNMFLVKDECCRYKATSTFAKICNENFKK